MSDLAHMNVAVGLLTFLGGLVSFFSPCVAPLMPGYIGFLASGSLESAVSQDSSGTSIRKDGDGIVVHVTSGFMSRRQRHIHAPWLVSLLFVGGFSVAFVILGLLAASFGVLVAAFKPVVETLVGIVMLMMGAFLLDLLPNRWMVLLGREGRIHLPLSAIRRLGLAGPFLLGILFAVGWTPCIGPVLAVLLTYVGASANLGAGAVLLGIYAVGFALPFFALGLGWSAGIHSLNWIKRHSRTLQRISGIGLILVGILYVSGQAPIFAAWAQRVAPHLPAPVLH